ncbi:hypothetical protein ACKGJO_13285 [Gracilimonas sp. Q87]|uniref:hypothetical protein n=1 Tax=Gracilimonas sp. Q87 TaxID=3384766 RepID=UPI003984469B
MKETIGRILAIGGVLGIVYYGWQYYEESDSFEAFGADIAVSTGDYVPIIISAVVMLVGIVITKLNFK